jgi:hypothetical protein
MNELREKVIEDLIAAFPEELLGERLRLEARQKPLRHCRMDLLFRDQRGRLVIVEVKKGELTRDVLGQVGEYLGLVKHHWAEKDVRFMVFGTTITPDRRIYFETIGAEVVVRASHELASFAVERGIDPAVGLLIKNDQRMEAPSEVTELALGGVSDEGSYLTLLREQPNTKAVEHLFATYAMLNGIGCSIRFKDQGRCIFKYSSSRKAVDVAYVGLNRQTSKLSGEPRYELTVLYRNIANTWGESAGNELRNLLRPIATPKHVAAMESDAPNAANYVMFNLGQTLTDEVGFNSFVAGLQSFLSSL